MRTHCASLAPGRRAFTLVELLVVIGIIALLISILMPTLSAARQRAQSAACLANLNQMGHALNMYVIDNRQVLPYQGTDYLDQYGEDNAPPNYLAELLPYVGGTKRVYACPAAPAETVAWLPTDKSDTNYLGNAAVLGHKIASIRRASQVIMVQEHWRRGSNAWLRPAAAGAGAYSIWHDSSYYAKEIYQALHDKAESGNCLYVDGHAENRRWRNMRSGEFGLVPDEPWSPGNVFTIYKSQWEP